MVSVVAPLHGVKKKNEEKGCEKLHFFIFKYVYFQLNDLLFAFLMFFLKYL